MSDPAISGAFHARDGWWFERTRDGEVGVTLTGLTSNPDVIDALIAFDADTWASIVAFVSATGDNAETWGRARRLHNGQTDLPTDRLRPGRSPHARAPAQGNASGPSSPMPNPSNSDLVGEATLEELIERGEVKSALLLKGEFTERERDLIRQAWEAGLASAAQQLEQAEQQLAEAIAQDYCTICGAVLDGRKHAQEALRELETLATTSAHEGWVRAEPVLLIVRAALTPNEGADPGGR